MAVEAVALLLEPSPSTLSTSPTLATWRHVSPGTRSMPACSCPGPMPDTCNRQAVWVSYQHIYLYC